MRTDDALVLIGHGSARYADAALVLQHHAASLRVGGRFRQVEVGLLNGTPTVREALAGSDAATIRVVPFFMEDGYFTRVAIPRVLGVDQRIRLCPPIGIHDGISRIVMAQARLACASGGLVCGETALLLVGHGSASAPGRALALHRHAATVAAAGLFAQCEAACLEEPPLLADTLRGLRAHPVIVLGFFAGGGTHVRDDVPAAIAAEQAGRGPGQHPVRFHGCVTDDPAMAQIILDQAGMSDCRRK